MLYMVAMIAFVSALAYSFTDTAKLYMDDLQSVKKFRGRDFSLTQIQRMLATTKSLSESALLTPVNEALRVCLQGGASGACTENCCKGNVDTGFTFKDPTDTAPQVANKRSLSSSPGSPVYYRADGTLCGAANGDMNGCAYGLTSTFVAHCPGGVASCDHAEHLKIKISRESRSLFSNIRDREVISYYFPKVNFQPALPVIPEQSLTVGSGLTLPITGDSGHPSEDQNFIFTLCNSGNNTVVKVTCQDFVSGVGQVVFEPLAAGTTTVTLQINDGGLENFLSKPYTFSVVVNP